jgi:predicted acylesterase/phospholipase RssA
MRKSRDVSRQCLFFLGLLTRTNNEKTDKKLEKFARFVLVKIQAFVNGVHVQNEYFVKKKQVTPAAYIKRILELFDYWQTEIRDTVNNMESLKLDDVSELKTKFETFLISSQEPNFTSKLLYHWLQIVLSTLRRHMYFIIGAILVAVALSSVDVVKNLLLNEGWGVLLPFFGVITTFVLIGILYFKWPLLGMGKDAFWSTKTNSPAYGVKRWPKENKNIQNLLFYKLALSAGLMVGMLILYGLFLSLLAIFEFDLIGRTSLTVYGFFALASLFLILCHLVDIWDFFDPRPIRLTALVLGVMFLVFSLGTSYGRQAAIIIVALLTLLTILSTIRSPKERQNYLFIVFLVALIIFLIIGLNNQKKGIWRDTAAAKSPVRIAETAWPYKVSNKTNIPVVVMAASGGGSRAAIFTAFALQKLHEDFSHIASQLQAISSVSGGSLTNAAYVARRYRIFDEKQDPNQLTLMLETLAYDVHQDFLQPALRGALIPGHNRGESIESDWRHGRVDLGEIKIGQLTKGWMEAQKNGQENPPYPLPLFNTCSLDGHDVVISSLPNELYRWGDFYQESPPWQDFAQEPGNRRWTWVYYRDAIYGLEDLLPNYDPELAPAVRASANFPFGFPLVQIETSKPLRFNPLPEKRTKNRKIVKLTDGGVLSNSGVWSLFNLLMQNANTLEKRGVLMIVVEASKMPEYRDNRRSFTSLYGTIGDKNPVGQALHRRMYDILAHRYGSKLAVVQIDIKPEEKFNVFTTWALDKRSFKRLDKAFKNCWQREKETIDDKWQSIQQEKSLNPLYIPATLRPPLS